MYFTNRDKVVLAQVLAIYADSHLSTGTSDFQRATDDLRRRIEVDLSGETDKVKEQNYEETDDDKMPGEDPAGEEDETNDAFTGESGKPQDQALGGTESPATEDGSGADGEDSLEFNPDTWSQCRRLARLPTVRALTGDGKFYLGEDGAGFQVNEFEFDVCGVDRIKRFAKVLHLRDCYGDWHVFNVDKFPKEWTKLLPVKKLVGVVE